MTRWERATWEIDGELEKKKLSYKVKIWKVLFANLDYYHMHSLHPLFSYYSTFYDIFKWSVNSYVACKFN